MSNLTGHITVFFLKILSLLPLRILFIISDFIYLIIYKLIGYRKKVVRENLQNSFPEKSEQEILKIEKDFYHFLCDLMVETIKVPRLSKKEILKRVRFLNPELPKMFFDQNQSVVAILGHHGSWEMTNLGFNALGFHKLYGIYTPLSNQIINQYIQKTRSKLGTVLIPRNNAYKQIDELKDELGVFAFVGDQAPMKGKGHWMTFLNQQTAVFMGAENVSKKYNFPVVFVDVIRKKRGHYEILTEVITLSPTETAEFEISEKFMQLLERQIRIQPETWLWSHRRWKHKRE